MASDTDGAADTGGMVSFEIESGAASGRKSMDSIKLVDDGRSSERRLSVKPGDEVEPSSSDGAGGQASLFSSAINMANTIMGVGLLALPRAFAHGGIVWGLLLSTLAAAVNVGTCMLISECQNLMERPVTLRALADKALPNLTIAIDISVLLNALGAACSYLIVATDCLQYVANRDGPRWYWTLLSVLLVTPLSFLRSMNSLRFSSLAAVVILLFITGVIITFLAGRDTPNSSIIQACPSGEDSESCPPGKVAAVESPIRTLSAISSLSLAYTCQVTVVPIGNEMERPTRRRNLIVFVSALGLAWILYALVAICGYLTFGDRVADNILDSYPDNGLTATARVGLAFVVIFSYPIQIFVARLSVDSLVDLAVDACCPSKRGRSPLLRTSKSDTTPARSSTSWFSRTFEVEPLPSLATTLFLCVTMAVALTVTELGIVVDLAGATGASMLSFVAPAILYYRLFPEPRHSPARIASVVIGFLGACTGIMGVCLAITEATGHPEAKYHHQESPPKPYR